MNRLFALVAFALLTVSCGTAGSVEAGAPNSATSGSVKPVDETTTTTMTTTTEAERDPDAEVREWAGQNSGIFDTLSGTFDDVVSAAEDEDATALFIACNGMLDAVNDIDDRDESPDPEIAEALGDAMSSLRLAARACMDGSLDFDDAKLTEASEHLDNATESLGTARQLLEEYL